MAKTMAQIDNGGFATNTLWYPDDQLDTEFLIDIGDRPVEIGDQYLDDVWYRDGERVLTLLEQAQVEAEALRKRVEALNATQKEYEVALSEIETALGVNA